ncbi:MAG: VWA domain-containing protein [Eubacterium sp.]|nr:VWA domain-containing protein [Eubacterium sp.]
MMTNPVLPNYISIPVLSLLLILATWSILLRRDRLWQKLLSGFRVLLILGLAFMINLRPQVKRYNTEIELKNIDALFVVDTTISMWADDYAKNKTRMDGVQETCDSIMDQLAGSNFALIRFDNRAQILAPFTQDSRSVSDAFSTIVNPDPYYAKGSSLNVPIDTMEELLISSSKKEERKTVIFFISDGEITDGSQLASFKELEQYVDGGAVLGFGTEDGGKMKVTNSYSSKNVTDPETGKDAISKLDEENLKKIADDLQVDYIHVREAGDISYLVETIKNGSSIRMEEAEMIHYEDIYYYLAMGLAALLIWELISIFVQRKL